MDEFGKDQDRGRSGQDEKNEKSAFGHLGDKVQQARQEYDKQQQLSGAETKADQQFGESTAQTGGQQGQNFAKDGHGATGETSRQQQDQGQQGKGDQPR